MRMVRHGTAKRVNPKNGMPRVGVAFSVVPAAAGAKPIDGAVILELGVLTSSSPDHLVEVKVRIGAADADTRELCVGPRQEDDAIYDTAEPGIVARHVSQMLAESSVTGAGPSFYLEVEKAAKQACESWRRVSASILAARLVALCGHGEASDRVDEEAVREVLDS